SLRRAPPRAHRTKPLFDRAARGVSRRMGSCRRQTRRIARRTGVADHSSRTTESGLRARCIERLQQRIRFMGARDRGSPVEYEKGDAADADLACLAVLGKHFTAFLIGGEHRLRFLERKTGFPGDARELLPTADVAAVDEVCAEQALDQIVARPRLTPLLRPRDQAMRIERVRLPDNPIELERDPHLLANLLDAGINATGARLAAEFRFEICSARYACARDVRIE